MAQYNPETRNILIDFPDYSTTDRRRVSKELDNVHRLWLAIKNRKPPLNIVIAVQKGHARVHHFLGKMDSVELKPLTRKQLCDSYLNKFKSLHPFTETSLSKVADMSLGNGRRFKRCLTSAVEYWRSRQEPQQLIDNEMIDHSNSERTSSQNAKPEPNISQAA